MCTRTCVLEHDTLPPLDTGIGYVGQPMNMKLRALGTLPNNVDWSIINPGLLGISVQDEERSNKLWNRRNLTHLMQHAVDQWTGSGSADNAKEADGHQQMSSSEVLLTAVPMKKFHYHIVVVAYEKTGDQTASIEIEVQVLWRKRKAVAITKGEEMEHDTDGEWPSNLEGEHGGSAWIIWWVLGTVVVTLTAVIVTFVMLRKKHFGSKRSTQQSGIEMNKVGYQTVKKHTIKPAVETVSQNEEQGILTV